MLRGFLLLAHQGHTCVKLHLRVFLSIVTRSVGGQLAHTARALTCDLIFSGDDAHHFDGSGFAKKVLRLSTAAVIVL